MQRRLTLAFVGIAIAAIALVGLGVLLMTQVGARAESRDRVSAQLEAVLELADTADSAEQFNRSLTRIGTAFNVDVLQIVIIDPSGEVTLPTQRNQRGDADNLFVLDDDDVEDLAGGEPIELNEGRQVLAIQRIVAAEERADQSFVGILIGENVQRIPRQATTFFLLSAGAVLLLAIAAAQLLARRITNPIRSIEEATSAISSGDLSTRVSVDGSDEIAQLAGSVNAMAADLDRSRALEQQFLLSVSHDLRTPLTAIRGYAEALVDGAATDTQATGSIISDHADRLARLVTDLLQLARLDARTFSIEPEAFDAHELAEEVIAGFQPVAAAAGVTLQLGDRSGEVFLHADRGRTAQILSNLIENGLKFADQHIEVHLGKDGGITSISVSDDGPGIAPVDLPHVFERLYVASQQPKRAESSSGLGLAIVRELARAMGGQAYASAGAAGGTVMTIELPAPSPVSA